MSCSTDSNNTDTPQGEEESTNTPRAIVIKHGKDNPIVDNTSGIPEFKQEVEESPYDGVIFTTNNVNERVFSAEPVTEEEIKNQLKLMKPDFFSRPVNSFLKMNTYNMKYTEENIATLVQNIKFYARVGKEAGFEGIAFDNEENYDHVTWVWSENDNESICPPGTSFEDCQGIVYNTGYRMMNAILEEWPDVKFMTFFGMWLRDDPAWDFILDHTIPRNKWNDPGKTEADFILGAYKAIHEKGDVATLIDGGEIYGIEKASDFTAIANYLRNDFPANSTLFANESDELREAYAKNIKIAFGIYDFRDRIFNNPPYNAQEYAQIVKNATYSGADYVWLFTELHDWWLKDNYDWPPVRPADDYRGHVPDEWKEAMAKALERD